MYQAVTELTNRRQESAGKARYRDDLNLAIPVRELDYRGLCQVMADIDSDAVGSVGGNRHRAISIKARLKQGTAIDEQEAVSTVR